MPGKDFVTTAMVAQFYDVDASSIREAVKNHRDEFDTTGYSVLAGQELIQLKSEVRTLPKSGRFLALWDRRAVLLLGWRSHRRWTAPLGLCPCCCGTRRLRSARICCVGAGT